LVPAAAPDEDRGGDIADLRRGVRRLLGAAAARLTAGRLEVAPVVVDRLARGARGAVSRGRGAVRRLRGAAAAVLGRAAGASGDARVLAGARAPGPRPDPLRGTEIGRAHV